ncbi:toll/interleukin-1 receptor domain-containing protein [Nitrosospira sp. NpAV]|uniref:toll/interleukin-1 receptor domain-containing protein n=1 Tax=Nitrosospira sp. NpAV TaxID=58133 RepID=UPI00059F0CD4|nr:toll/interleukin-1 receptor domain-containing protein [Nitrosospira sp. NpAV]KIO48441.1 hypothetical protein SQ11_11955 [Nitrosospira sp. NpAV]
MTTDIESKRLHPKAFLSYAWESNELREWVRDLATRLRSDGIDVMLDQWSLHPGDELPQFMENAVRDNDYVLIICTPYYAERSNQRRGGVGYEGDIMTAEVLNTRNKHKFIPLFRAGDHWEAASPTWLQGAYRIDFRGDPYSDEQYYDLLTTLHGKRAVAPPMGPKPVFVKKMNRQPTTSAQPFEPITIMGVVVDEVTVPQNDGTPGSALYRIPFQLSQRPSYEWSKIFIEKWNHPSSYTTMHRPGIANISDDRVYLDGTTLEEVEKYHRNTLKLALKETNQFLAAQEQDKRIKNERERQRLEEHQQTVRDLSNRISFND